MRDLVVATLLLGSIPFILRQPFIGLLVWVVFGILNPHQFAWGWALSIPFGQLVAGATILSILIHARPRWGRRP